MLKHESSAMSSRIDAGKLSAWYDFQAPLYHLWRDNYAHPLVKRVVDILDNKEPQKVLDAGCGSGLMSIGIALLRPNWTIEGVDASLGLLSIARKQAGKRSLCNVCFRQGDVTALEFGAQKFSAVIASGLFPNINDPLRALHEIFRVLETGGRFVVVEFDRSAMGLGTKYFFRLMIGGYRFFSTIFPGFRFAEEWSVDLSTINEKQFGSDLRAAGFSVESTLREQGHLIFLCRKP